VRGGLTDSFKEDGIMSRVAPQPTAKPVTPGTPPHGTPAGPSVPREKIAMRAYEKWLKSGCQHGCDRQHWLEAEAELRAEMARGNRH
jgi:hypothetical protein